MSYTTVSPQFAFLANAGRIGDQIRQLDWSATPMGPIETWPATLRTTLGIMLSSSFPTFLAWGTELTLLYNDAYVPLLGKKAANALGRPWRDVWSELIDELQPQIDRVIAGESLFFENYAVTLMRNGFPELAYFTFSYSPVCDEAAGVRGMLCTVIEMTDKFQALARHKEAEERLAFSLEASGNIGTWSHDLQDGTTFVDERFARLFQLDAALAVTGTELTKFTDLIHDEDRPRVLDAIAEAIASGEQYDVEYRIPQRSGVDAWVNARGKVFQDPVTGRRRFAGVAVDISDRKSAQLAGEEHARRAAMESARARENGRLLNGLLDSAPVGIVYVDRDGRLLITNATNRVIWGDHPATSNIEDYAEWKGWWPAGTELAGERIRAEDWPIAHVLRGARSASTVAEIEPFGSPGKRRTILIRAAAVEDESGRIIGAVAANMDISAQLAAEKALEESELKFRSITNVIPQIVWAADANGENNYINSRWGEFTGDTAGTSLGPRWAAFIHPDDLRRLSENWAASLATGSLFEVEHRLLHHSGEYRWVLNRALPMFDERTHVRRWMGTLTDVHDAKLAEQELKAASRRKDEFLAMLAHELRNPLAPISNATELLALRPGDERHVRKSTDVIARQVRHMTELIDDLLDVSRVTRGLVQLEMQAVDVQSVLAGAVEQARPLIESRRHTLALALDPGAAWVQGDRTRLVQILANLLNNAAKYTPQGGTITLALEHVVTAGESCVRLSVRDTGVGISAELLPHVFDLFTQAERTPDRAQGGLGLGLALVRSLVQLHGGRVRTSSAGVGQGSTFTVELPLAAAPVQAAAPLASGRPGAAPKSLMIVDDNVDSAESLAEILRVAGHTVTVCTHPMDALADVERSWPDVFILDIGLPEIDGYELARRLQARASSTGAQSRYIALTGYGQSHDRVLSKTVGFCHHFVKPVDLLALLAAIDEPCLEGENCSTT